MIADAQGSLTLAYDWRSLPLSVSKSGVTTTYRYDAEGRRMYKSTAVGLYVFSLLGPLVPVVGVALVLLATARRGVLKKSGRKQE